MNEVIDLNKINKFEDLQKASCILRKALKEIRSITTGSNSNSFNLSSSSSSNNSSILNDNDMNTGSDVANLAFDNLTYMSSVEDLTQSKLVTSQTSQEVLKKTLKSIKRKDKLKKVVNQSNEEQEEINEIKKNSSKTKSMPDLSNLISTNTKFEKELRKLFRNKSFNRSLRRAKSVYYRNQRSKSLEDLTIEEKINFILNTSSSYLKLGSKKQNSSLSINSSCSTNTGLSSDISSSYFHELSDWSPDYSSSESESSEDEIYQNIDWDANFSNLNFSEFNTSDEEEEDKENALVSKKEEKECLKQLNNQLNTDADKLENLLNDVVSKMFKVHPILVNESQKQLVNNSFSSINIDNLKPFLITSKYLNDQNNQQKKCFICMSIFDLDEEALNLNNCSHTFHFNCIQAWLSKHSNCPLCRNSNFSNRSINENRIVVKRETLL